MTVQSADAVSGLSHIYLGNFVFIVFADQVINTWTIDSGYFFRFCEKWARDDIALPLVHKSE